MNAGYNLILLDPLSDREIHLSGQDRSILVEFGKKVLDSFRDPSLCGFIEIPMGVTYSNRYRVTGEELPNGQ